MDVDDFERPLVPERSFGEAFGYGARMTMPLIREHLWLYCIIGVAAVLWYVAAGIYFPHWRVDVSFIAYYAALASTTRLAQPSYRMRFSTIVALFCMSLLLVVPAALAFGACALLMKLVPEVGAVVGLLMVVGVIAAIVAAGKLAYCANFYTLAEHRGGSIIAAIARSWQFVDAGMWWRTFGIQFVIGLCVGIPATIVSAILVASLLWVNPIAAFIACGVISSVMNIVIITWSSASRMALLTSPPDNPVMESEAIQPSAS